MEEKLKERVRVMMEQDFQCYDKNCAGCQHDMGQVVEFASSIRTEAQQEQNEAWIVACLKFLRPSQVAIPKDRDLYPEDILKLFLPAEREVSRD